MRLASSLLLTAVLLAACGYKGPLTLPKSDAPPPPASVPDKPREVPPAQ